MESKNKGREDCKNEYILQLQQTNKDQRDYYSTKLPAVFQVSCGAIVIVHTRCPEKK